MASKKISLNTNSESKIHVTPKINRCHVKLRRINSTNKSSTSSLQARQERRITNNIETISAHNNRENEIRDGENCSTNLITDVNISENNNVSQNTKKCVVKVNRSVCKKFNLASKSSTKPFQTLTINSNNNMKDNNNKDGRLATPILTNEARAKMKKLSLNRSKEDTQTASNSKNVNNNDNKSSANNKLQNAKESAKPSSSNSVDMNRNSNNSINNRNIQNRERTNMISKNIAHKPDLIEQLLSDDYDEIDEEVHEQVNDEESEEKIDEGNKQIFKSPKKFFHRKNRENNEERNTSNNVYEFISNTQNSDSDTAQSKDPAADVIKKLIREGKVQVVRHRRGRPKRNVRKALVNNKARDATKKPNLKKKVEVKTNALNKKKNVLMVAGDNESNCSDDHYNDFDFGAVNENNLTDANSAVREKKERHIENNNENLTRLVLMKQASKGDMVNNKLLEKRRLLQAAIQHVSTPINRRTAPAHLAPANTPSNISPITAPGPSNLISRIRAGSDFPLRTNAPYVSSPISARQQDKSLTNIQSGTAASRSAGKNASLNLHSMSSPLRRIVQHSEKSTKTSPWRVDDNIHLPSVFNFSRDSFHLPSYSSDYVPNSPQKRKQHVYLEPRIETLEEQTKESTTHTRSSLSSSTHSYNDSNGENMPPSLTTNQEQRMTAESLNTRADQNAEIFNSRQLPNPLRNLGIKRSPLKAINILEVVQLPSWKPAEKNNTLKNNTNSSKNNSANRSAQKQAQKGTNERSTENLFGFEEFLENNSASQEIVDNTANESALNNQTLRNKLHELKKLRPPDETIAPGAAQQMPKIFDEVNAFPDEGLKQQKIKQMLCSTMIPVADKNEQGDDDSSDDVAVNENDCSLKKNTSSDSPVLFTDVDPDFKFNNETLHRTYVRPMKRKRKLRHNFVMCLDSDESGEEDQDALHDSGEEEEPHAKKKKKSKKDAKLNKDIEHFAKEFNKMIEEAENYEIVVEKSTDTSV